MTDSKWRVNIVEVDAFTKDASLIDSRYFDTLQEANDYMEKYNNDNFMQDMDSDTYQQVRGPFRV